MDHLHTAQEAHHKLLDIITKSAKPLEGNHLYASLMDQIGDCRIVLMGEATHGTREFYEARMELSRQLIREKGFMAIAIEGDWPDTYHIHRYIQGIGNAEDSLAALSAFQRFPRWMWRNETLPPFLRWLREHNDALPAHQPKTGFYGIDLYSLNASMEAVVTYLDKVDPEAARHARERYACFDHMNADPQRYSYLVSMNAKKPCIKEAMEQLLDLQHHAFEYIRKESEINGDDYFSALQNARVIRNAERYYRSMFEERISSWNLRDTHMAESLEMLLAHLEKCHGRPARIILWAHNSHVGDARATEMGTQGEINIGQLVREKYDTDSFLIGFSTSQGTVTAASHWDGPAQCKTLNKGTSESYEALFHETGYRQFQLDLRNNPELEHYLKIPRLQRAVGVIYRPDAELASHYFYTHLAYQFDTMIHIDETTAVTPIDHG